MLSDSRPSYGTYIEFLAGLIVILCVSYLVLGGFGWFVDTLGTSAVCFWVVQSINSLPFPPVHDHASMYSTPPMSHLFFSFLLLDRLLVGFVGMCDFLVKEP